MDNKLRAKTRSLSAIIKNRAPTYDTTAVSLGTNDVGPSSKDLSFVLNNFKEIEKVRFNAAFFLLLALTFLNSAVVWPHKKNSVFHRDHRELCLLFQV
jgi:hypothetical protein